MLQSHHYHQPDNIQSFYTANAIGVLYNLWPLANIELSGAQLLATA